ncbi:flagellar basal body P-ring formation chaperone FlgA [Cognatishimia maritima]|uniref:Flagella basal body P-ring formation protein FlgA n=1 Tax=Cognatishimia maritima TaxID=870908 RepID=A0A1M5VTC8_9RHOB|nr:flagellar basal body P-ring formation chaperone FlgA [Cognatishimia maritima]SHH78440.1 flagella basal body P-ring formation protein FlgA [Cognatishimia maritima]
MTRRAIHFLITLWIALLPGVALAVPVTDLVIERAEQEFGPTLPTNGSFSVRMAQGTPAEGEFIKEFWIDPDSGQFIANLVTERGDIRRIQGLAILNIPVPVVTRRVMPEEILTEADIQIVDMPWARVHSFAVTEFDGLNGMQVRRMLTPGRPVHRQSVIPPIIVARGDRVIIELKYGPLQLTATGKAISDAHLGQEVRVVNLSSNKTITAVARADGVVEALF